MESNLEEVLSFNSSFKERDLFLDSFELETILDNFNFDFNNSTIPKVINPSSITTTSSSTPLPSTSKRIGRPKGSKNRSR